MFCCPVQNSYCFIMAVVVFQVHLKPSALSTRMDDLLWLWVQVNCITKHFYPNSPKMIRAESTKQWQQKCQIVKDPGWPYKKLKLTGWIQDSKNLCQLYFWELEETAVSPPLVVRYARMCFQENDQIWQEKRPGLPTSSGHNGWW